MKTNFTNAVNQSGINKVDILFDIDNSASMGDKQAYLIQAIPQMIARLVTPTLPRRETAAPAGANATPPTGRAARRGAPEFAPVHDMHIGVVTSSLGPRLGVAQTHGGVRRILRVRPERPTSRGARRVHGQRVQRRPGAPHQSDHARARRALALPLARGVRRLPLLVPDARQRGEAPGAARRCTLAALGVRRRSPGTLVGDFSELVGGAGESGCGIESQLESWYRFLIQPDPYATLGLDELDGTGARGAASTRPSSSSATTSFAPIRSWRHRADRRERLRDRRPLVPGDRLQLHEQTRTTRRAGRRRASTNPNDPQCRPAAASRELDQARDPACCADGHDYTDDNDWGYNLNLRHVHMRQKYGVDPQFPLTRYYNGLTSDDGPEPDRRISRRRRRYAGTNNCTNPLFAATLPTAADVPDASDTPAEIGTTLCNLPAGAARTPADVFYAHIGGVPHQLLQSTPGSDGTCPAGTAAADCPQKDTLAPPTGSRSSAQGPAAYTGRGGRLSYDYTGIDPHMIESMYAAQPAR